MGYKNERLPVQKQDNNRMTRGVPVPEPAWHLMTSSEGAVDFLKKQAGSLGEKISAVTKPATDYYQRLTKFALKGADEACNAVFTTPYEFIFVTAHEKHYLPIADALRETGLADFYGANASNAHEDILRTYQDRLYQQAGQIMSYSVNQRTAFPLRIERNGNNSFTISTPIGNKKIELTQKERTLITIGGAVFVAGALVTGLGAVLIHRFSDGGNQGGDGSALAPIDTDDDKRPQPTSFPTSIPGFATATPVFPKSVAPIYTCGAHVDFVHGLNFAEQEKQTGQNFNLPTAVLHDGATHPLNHVTKKGETISEALNVLVNQNYTGVNHKFFCLPTLTGDVSLAVLHVDTSRPGLYETLIYSPETNQLINAFDRRIVGNINLDQRNITAVPYMTGEKDGTYGTGFDQKFIAYVDNNTTNIVALYDTESKSFITGNLAAELAKFQNLKFAADVPNSMREQIGKDAVIDHYNYVLSPQGDQLVPTVTLKDGTVHKFIPEDKWNAAKEEATRILNSKIVTSEPGKYKDMVSQVAWDKTTNKWQVFFVKGNGESGKGIIMIPVLNNVGLLEGFKEVRLPGDAKITGFDSQKNSIMVSVEGKIAFIDTNKGFLVDANGAQFRTLGEQVKNYADSFAKANKLDIKNVKTDINGNSVLVRTVDNRNTRLLTLVDGELVETEIRAPIGSDLIKMASGNQKPGSVLEATEKGKTIGFYNTILGKWVDAEGIPLYDFVLQGKLGGEINVSQMTQDSTMATAKEVFLPQAKTDSVKLGGVISSVSVTRNHQDTLNAIDPKFSGPIYAYARDNVRLLELVDVKPTIIKSNGISFLDVLVYDGNIQIRLNLQLGKDRKVYIPFRTNTDKNFNRFYFTELTEQQFIQLLMSIKKGSLIGIDASRSNQDNQTFGNFYLLNYEN